MKKVKIALVQPVQAPYWTERLRCLAENEELEIFLLLERESFDDRPGWEPESIAGVKTVILGSQVRSCKTYNPDMGYVVSSFETIPWRLSRVLVDIKPDVVVVCNAKQLAFALPARLRLGFVLSLIVEDTFHSTRNRGMLQLFLKKVIYRRANTWMPFNQDAKDFLRSLGIGERIFPSSWSVDSQKFMPDLTARSETGKQIISVVGALIERKGVIQLLHAWRAIPRANRQNFELRIAGTGPLQGEMEGCIRDNNLDDVVLVGHLPYSDIIRLFQTSCLAILPTLEDVYGMVVLEAMACGCPVITTPYAGSRELVDEGITGWIADPLSEQELANTLSMAMSDIHRLNVMGLESRKKALVYDTSNVMTSFAGRLIEMSKSW